MNDSSRGTAPIDQSKLSTLGKSSSQKLRNGRYKKVSDLVNKESESEAGLSAGANSGGLLPMK